MKKYRLYQVKIIIRTVIVFFSVVFPACQAKLDIQNPYKTVDWDRYIQYKANLHTHTTISDGSLSPQSMVELYDKYGYKILAITDHNRVTYPWEKFTQFHPSQLCSIRNDYAARGIKPEESRYEPRGITPEALIFENRYPSKIGMVAVQGNEITLNREHPDLGLHDMGSYFSDQSDITLKGEETLTAITEKNGLAFFMHPGRYDFSTEWYLNFYNRFDCLTGLELYNAGETRCIEIWDSLLVELMPERPVWGFSNDDTHTLNHFGGNWNMFILPELSERAVRNAMEQGLLFFVYASEGRKKKRVNPPVIESVDVDIRKGIIAIEAAGHDSVLWISEGKKIYNGDEINLNKFPEVNKYIRAVVYGEGGKTIVGTQPFGIRR